MTSKRGFRSATELTARRRIREIRRADAVAPRSGPRRGAGDSGTTNRFRSRSRPALPAEILGGFSSSLLPPSFPRGRSATFFFAPRCPAPGGRIAAVPPP
jgi:hypothetical protein